jgi:L-ascorbate metabolism protein UlaG (beta-lactamase superfamily)
MEWQFCTRAPPRMLPGKEEVMDPIAVPRPAALATLLLLAVVATACAGRRALRPRPEERGPGPARGLTVTLVGGPTAVLDLGGARFLTDPTFSDPGPYEVVPGRSLRKLEAPALPEAGLGRIDAVLLSHDQHPDNLDPAGRALVARAPVTFSTPAAAGRLAGRVTGLAPWTSVAFSAAGRTFRITGVPAQHGPDGSEAVTGPVTGFVLESDGQPTVYVSGDNASVEVVRAVAARFRVDVAVLFAGGAKSPRLGDALLTLDGARAVEAAGALPGAVIVPVHFRGWGHLTEGPDELRGAFAAAGLRDRLVLLEPGRSVTLPPPPAVAPFPAGVRPG